MVRAAGLLLALTGIASTATSAEDMPDSYIGDAPAIVQKCSTSATLERQIACMSYLESFIAGATAAEAASDITTFCIPKQTYNMGQLAAMLQKYVSDRPEKWHFGRTVLTFAFLRDSFPCSSKTP